MVQYARIWSPHLYGPPHPIGLLVWGGPLPHLQQGGAWGQEEPAEADSLGLSLG